RGTDPSTWHTKGEMINKWYQTINKRLQYDIAMTHPKLPKHKRLKDALVQETWSNILENENELPDEWTNSTGVLVG
ncbi:hypothetical protein BC629DRAFT_1258464, partial [Irpex lacteus]